MVIDIMNKTKIKRLIIAFLSVAAVVLFGMIFTKGTYDFYDTFILDEKSYSDRRFHSHGLR